MVALLAYLNFIVVDMLKTGGTLAQGPHDRPCAAAPVRALTSLSPF